ncbi:MAG: hypothetical protein WC819_01885 [Parcubacteria group bacterium]|jgi:hypothetical protein
MDQKRSFYTTIEDAKVEIQRRWKDDALKERVREYLSGEIPEPFQHEPRAVLSRNIISPDFELRHFVKMAQELHLAPLGLEGVHDIFVTNNEDKMLLVKPRFFKGYDKNHDVISQNKLIVDLAQAQGKRFDEIVTLWGEKLVDFHHRIAQKYVPQVEIFDDFEWFAENHMKTSIDQYYKKFLALFVAHGVLFENFTDVVAGEEEFTREIFNPAFDEIVDTFGVSPLIIPAQPEEEVMDVYWWCYPKDVMEDVHV